MIDTDEMRPNLYDDYPQSAQLLKQGLPTSEITLAELFKGIGYNTAIIGKWHLGYGESNHPSRFGFDTQYGFVEAFSLYDQEDDPDVVNYYHDLFWGRTHLGTRTQRTCCYHQKWTRNSRRKVSY